MHTSHNRTLRHLCVLIAVAASAMLAPTAPAGAAVEKSIWGPDRFPVGHPECPSGPTACSAFPLYRQLGADNYQVQILWDRIAPTRPANPRNPADPAYNWPAYADFDVLQAAANGIGVALLVKGTPSWANGGQSFVWAPTNPQDYADFLYAAAQRYPSVRRWMIWGEPNYGYNFQPMPPNSPVGPRKYAQILDKAYVALKQANRSNIVIGGMTVVTGDPVSVPDFIRWMRVGKGKKKRPPRMDWFGHNAFDARYPNLRDNVICCEFRGFNDIDTLRKDLKRAYKPKKKKKKGGAAAAKKRKVKLRVPPLWLSEWTVVSDHAAGNLFSGFYVSRQEQANWITAAYSIASRTPYVKGLGWYRLDDEPASSTNATWGLMTYNGERKPSFYAYAAVP
jgi:hypothetical protein